jgi:glycosyltransferase involved in cell wall biosynthesis
VQNARLILKVRRLIKARQIDLVHANEHWVGPVSYVAARLAGIPVICHFRTGLGDLTPGRVRKYLYGRYDKVIAVAEVLRGELLKYVADPSKITVIRDGVAPALDIPGYRSQASRRILINVGAIYRVKGQAIIADAVMPWLKANPRNYLVFVGGTREDPAYFEGIRHSVTENGLARQVRFLGSRKDVPRLLGLADALVAYSSVEGVPMVVMEAMFAGRPVIVSNTRGMDEVVTDNEVGHIVDFESGKQKLAGVLEDLTVNPGRWKVMGQRARERAAARYSTRAMSNAIQAVYKEVLEIEDNAAVRA